MNKSIVWISLIGIAGFTLISWLRKDVDVLAVFAVMSIFILQVINLVKANEVKEVAKQTQEQARETHLSVNSRLDAFIKQAAEAAKAEGEKEGRNAANARTDELARQAQQITE